MAKKKLFSWSSAKKKTGKKKSIGTAIKRARIEGTKKNKEYVDEAKRLSRESKEVRTKVNAIRENYDDIDLEKGIDNVHLAKLREQVAIVVAGQRLLENKLDRIVEHLGIGNYQKSTYDVSRGKKVKPQKRIEVGSRPAKKKKVIKKNLLRKKKRFKPHAYD